MPTTTTREPNEGLRRHKLMPATVRKALPRIKRQDRKGYDATVHLKVFSPYCAGTWLFTEFDGDDTLYGFGSPFGLADGEWGYSSLREIAETTVFGRVPAIERDCHFDECTVAEYLASNGLGASRSGRVMRTA